jgi:hypothetical protein
MRNTDAGGDERDGDGINRLLCDKEICYAENAMPQ